ncbi:MAG: ZIP family metal transporter [Verrucomicrobiae bacterium]|nr:ZIP family metal transporter [Verrucomicrobiae bacterium]
MNVWAYALGSVVVVSLISLVGIFTLTLRPELLRKLILYLVSFAVGALFGDAFIHLIPAAFESLGAKLHTSLLIIGGLLLFFVLEKFVRWRHCHVHSPEHEHVHPVAAMNLIGHVVHNLIDGMLIGASYQVSIPIGLATTLAIVLHEIPQEIGDFGILVHAGMAPKRALLLNFLSAITAVLGTVLVLAAGMEMKNLAQILLPITAGGFLYIAGSDLIPELHHEVKLSTSLAQFLSIVLGIAVMAALVLLE